MSQEQNQQQNHKQQGGNKKKVEAGFKSAMSKLEALVGGKGNLSLPSKVEGGSVSDIVSELFKEEREAKLKEVKSGLKDLIIANSTLNKNLKVEREKLEQLELTKKKQFTTAANKLYAQIEGIGELEASYRESMEEVKNSIEPNDDNDGNVSDK